MKQTGCSCIVVCVTVLLLSLFLFHRERLLRRYGNHFHRVVLDGTDRSGK